MINVSKQEIEIEESSKRKFEVIASFVNSKATFINGSIRYIDKTNLTYLEPHRVQIKGINILFFNYKQELYIENLSNPILFNNLEAYLKSI